MPKTGRVSSRLLRPALALVSLAVIASLLYVWQEGLFHDAVGSCRHFFETKRLESFIASYGAYAGLVFVGLQALQVMVAPVPGEVTGFVGGYLFGTALGTVLSTAGLTLGSLGAFFIARVFGLRLVEKVVRKEYRDRFDYWVTHRGLYIAFVLFLIPFPKDALCYLLGLTHLRLRPFIFMNVVGRLPGTLVLAWQGSAVDNGHYWTFLFLLIASLLVTLVLYLYRDRLTQVAGPFVNLIMGKRKEVLPGKEKQVCRLSRVAGDSLPQGSPPT